MNHDNRPIGIFDSGIGGLTIVDGLKQLMPDESMIYFGDTQHLPYCDKSSKTVQGYSLGICEFLIKNNCKAIVIACNTASALAQDVIQAKFPEIKIYNVIDPVVKEVAKSDVSKVGVIATRATIKSGIYAKKIHDLNPNIKTVSLATPLLVPMIEEGFHNQNVSHEIISSYLSNELINTIDELILGCTHYPLIKEEIGEYYNNKITIVDSPSIVAKHVFKDLQSSAMLSHKRGAEYAFYVSDLTDSFEASAERFIHYKDIHLNEIKLWEKEVK
jgi:glutamate racemase